MKLIVRLAAVLFALLMIGYSLGISALLIARMLRGELFAPVAAFNSLLPAALLPGLVFLLVALLYRGQNRLRLMLAQLPAVLALLILYGGHFLPTAAASAPAEAARLRVLTFNVNHHNNDSAGIVEIITDANPDVVALQELNAGLAVELGALLRESYPHQFFNTESRWWGKGLLSRHPLTEQAVWHSPDAPPQQRAVLAFDGQPVVVYNIHMPMPFNFRRLGYDGSDRAAEVRDILERSYRETQPLILAGDFNLTDQTYDYWHITQTYTDSFRATEGGFGFTFANWSFYGGWLGWLPPLTRIDYVFHSADFAPLTAQVWGDSAGADHFPLLVELALLPSS